MTTPEAGALTGWVYNSKEGDSFIDFGLWTDENRRQVRDFHLGTSGALLLDFNVEGNIIQKLAKTQKDK